MSQSLIITDQLLLVLSTKFTGTIPQLNSGVESTIRFVMNVAHILCIRDLVKAFRKQCTRCRYILKRTVEANGSNIKAPVVCSTPLLCDAVWLVWSFSSILKTQSKNHYQGMDNYICLCDNWDDKSQNHGGVWCHPVLARVFAIFSWSWFSQVAFDWRRKPARPRVWEYVHQHVWCSWCVEE